MARLARNARNTELLAAIFLLLAPLSASAESRQPQREEGILNLIWGDPHPAGASVVAPFLRASLVRADGSEVPLELGPFANLAVQYFGRPVVAIGRASGPEGSILRVESISGGAGSSIASPFPAIGGPVTGTRKVIFLLLKYSDDTEVPHPPQFFADITNPDLPPPGANFPTTINAFFKRTSFEQFSWIGDVGGAGGVPATDWLTLPFPKLHYAPCGWSSVCTDFQAIVDDGMNLGVMAGIDFTQYDNVNLVLSNDLDCCAWGGGAVFQGQFYSTTWEPPWGQETGIYVHEMGHSVGLPHSGWLYYDYDSPWDMMSSPRAVSTPICGSYFSRNSNNTANIFCSEPGDGYIAAHRDFLGWIPEEYQIVVDPQTPSTSVTLEGAALPLGDALKMVKVCLPDAPCSGPTARYISVEARVKGLGPDSQFDNAIPGDGVILHDFQGDRAPIGEGNPCYFNSASGWAVPIDATPGDFAGPPDCENFGALSNAQWLAGQTYFHPSRLQIAVTSRDGSLFDVTIRGLVIFIDDLESGDLEGWSSSVGAP